MSKSARNEKGQVVCALFSSASDFPKKAENAVASVFHDENSNGKLDTNFMGIPREGVGASNDAKGHLGPPKFNAAAFRFGGGRLDLKITINYL
jgi:uncharacterized protein (DUF2141 family)